MLKSNGDSYITTTGNTQLELHLGVWKAFKLEATQVDLFRFNCNDRYELRVSEQK